MTRNEVRAVGRKLTGLHMRFESCFGRKESRKHSLVYLRGLLLGEGRKNVERIALRFAKSKDGSPPAENEVVALQEFITASPWSAEAVMREVQAVFAEEFVPSTSKWTIGTVGVFDGTTFTKRGSESCGVSRQYCGRLGQSENCQTGEFLVGVTPAGTVMLDHQLYLPKQWIKDKARRRKTHVPKSIRFMTRPQMAIVQLTRTLAAGHVRFDWIGADAERVPAGNWSWGMVLSPADPGHVPDAGAAPTHPYDIEPTGWLAAGPGLRHALTITWDCCCPNRKPRFVAVPDQ